MIIVLIIPIVFHGLTVVTDSVYAISKAIESGSWDAVILIIK